MDNNITEALLSGDDDRVQVSFDAISDIGGHKDLERIVTLCLETMPKFAPCLFRKGVNINALLSERGYAPLHLAIHNGDESLFYALLELEANVAVRTSEDVTPLDLCVTKDNFGMFDALLRRDARVVPGLVHRLCGGLVDTRFLGAALDAHAIDANTVDRHGHLPLHTAVAEERLDCVKLLVPLTHDINHRAGADERTPLHLAAESRNWELIHLLLEEGGDLRVADAHGSTPMDGIIRRHNHGVVRGLAAHYTDNVIHGQHNQLTEMMQCEAFQKLLDLLAGIDHLKPYAPMDASDIRRKIENSDTAQDDVKSKSFVEFISRISDGGAQQTATLSDTELDRLCELVVKFVLDKCDCDVLLYLMSNDLVWLPIEKRLIEKIQKLYLWSVRKCRSMGALEVVSDMFVSGQCIDMSKLCKWLSRVTGIHRLSTSSDADVSKGPLRSLITWAILADKLELLPVLLRTNRYEPIPMSLYASNLLHKLSKHRALPYFVREKNGEMAKYCETVAVDVLRVVSLTDASPMKSVCLQYLRTPLEHYGAFSCLDLAATAHCAEFLHLKLCQQALDMEWYRDLYYFRPISREALVLLAVIPYNLYVVRIIEKKKDNHKLKRRNCARNDSSIGEVDIAKSGQTADETDGFLSGKHSNLQLAPPYDKLPIFGDVKQKCCDHIRQFSAFLDTPAVKFRYHAISLLIFLCIFSYVVMLDFHYNINLPEAIVYCFILGFTAEEIYEFISIRRRENTRSYFLSTWNIIDMIAIVLSILGFLARSRSFGTSHIHDAYKEVKYENTLFYVARMFFCVSLLCYYIRLIYMATVLETLGPKVKMIAKMIWNDLLPFLFILFVFMLSFGIIFQALLYPNGFAEGAKQPWNASHALQSMVKLTFFSMMGDYQLDRIGGESCSSHDCPHPTGAIIVPLVFMIVYVVIMNILLLNLVIALFSKTVDDIDSRSRTLWQFERYDMIREFSNRSSLPPPFNLLTILRSLVTRLVLRRRHSDSKPFVKCVAAEYLFFFVYQAIALRNNRLHLAKNAADDGTEIGDINNKLSKIEESIKLINEKLELLTVK